MLSITDPALERLLLRLIHNGAAAEMALRFKRSETGWTLCLDQEAPGDTTFRRDGRTVLLLDKAVSEQMANMTLYTKKKGRRTQLKLSRGKTSGN